MATTTNKPFAEAIKGRRQRSFGRLTELACKNAKPKDKPYRLPDGGNLYLEVSPNGARRWFLKYFYATKESRQALGVYPAVTLAAVRDKAKKAKELLADGLDPNVVKKQAKLDRQISTEDTFEAVALEWFKQKQQEGKWGEHHTKTIQQRLDTYVLPILGKQAVTEIKTKDLLYCTKKIAQTGKLNLAGAVSQYIAGIMRQAVQIGHITNNPALDMRGGIASPKETHRPALPLEHLPELKKRIDSYDNYATSLALKFALLTGARSSEFRFARWTEFDFERPEWIISTLR